MQLKIKKFDPSKVPSDSVLVFIGKRNTGKSFLLRDIMYYQKDIPIGTVISPTEAANCFYGKMIPSLFIHDEYTPQLIKNVVERQKKIKKRINKELKTYSTSTIDPRSFLILDDCLYDGVWKKDKNIRYLFQNGRHIKTMLMVTMQFPLGIPPDLRTNVDFAFILREPNFNNRRRIYDNYASIFPSFEIFSQCMDNLTNGYGCIVIDNTTRSNKLEDNVYWYIAEGHDNFTIGSKEYWTISNQNTVNDSSSENEEDDKFDPSNFRKKSSLIDSLNIKKVY